jgi:Spy/CpxP family protein refolding chaperone
MRFDRLFKLGFLFAAGCFLLIPGVYPSSDLSSQPQNDAKISKDRPVRHDFGDDLGLSAEQKKFLEENRSESKKQLGLLHKQMREKMEMIKQEFEKEKFSPSAVRHINEEIKTIQARMMDERLSSMLAVCKILTHEQFRKFAAKMGEMGEKFRDRKDEFKPKGAAVREHDKFGMDTHKQDYLGHEGNVSAEIPAVDISANKK